MSSSQLQRKIKRAEEQLVKRGGIIKEETKSQTQRTIPFKMASRTLIVPGARDVPKYSAK